MATECRIRTHVIGVGEIVNVHGADEMIEMLDYYDAKLGELIRNGTWNRICATWWIADDRREAFSISEEFEAISPFDRELDPATVTYLKIDA